MLRDASGIRQDTQECRNFEKDAALVSVGILRMLLRSTSEWDLLIYMAPKKGTVRTPFEIAEPENLRPTAVQLSSGKKKRKKKIRPGDVFCLNNPPRRTRDVTAVTNKSCCTSELLGKAITTVYSRSNFSKIQERRQDYHQFFFRWSSK